MIRGFPKRDAIPGTVAVTIGSFDGVHRGHQRLLHQLTADQAVSRGVLITFDPHPRCVLDPRGCPPLLTLPEERAVLALEHGADDTVVLAFNREMSQWSADAFCDRLLESMDVRRFVIGPGFGFGRGRSGDESFLRDYGAAHGFEVIVAQPVMHAGERVSSGRVRSAIETGDMEGATALLGRHARLPGPVVRGDGRGRELGFPTANLTVDPTRCMPARGVYATWFGTGSRWYPAATSVGIRPTFNAGGTLSVEAYLLDVDTDLYDQDARIDFVQRLRDEVAFESADALIAQMHRDVEAVRDIMSDRGEPGWIP